MIRFNFLVSVLLIGCSSGMTRVQAQSDITIVVPYDNASAQVEIWAHEEDQIDFRKHSGLASRCTTAYAATELKYFISETLNPSTITYASSRPEKGFFIELAITDPASRKDSFTIEPVDTGIVITGDGRTGLLYGAYELLRIQGWRWHAPGKRGQTAPPKRDQLVLPSQKKHYKPDMDLGRGFYMEYVSQASTDICIWMARNRLNVLGYRPTIGPLAEKLGMIFNNGGHIFEKILDPDRVLPSGQTIWQQHPQWYGLPADGVRKKDTALKTQFCASQPDLMEFLGEEVLKLLMGKWRQADLVEIWGFDTWGSTCTCEQCAKLGNSTDQMLHFLSAIRASLNRARAQGRLDHDVTLSACAYEGTNSLVGPENPFPKNLIDAGDTIVFYPINRCYAHSFYDADCTENNRYRKALKSWFAQSPAMGVYFGEYYNVSKYEDLPVLFSRTMRKDIPGHHEIGCRGITYMHLPFVNWGPRTLTQSLYAQLAWDADTDVDAFLVSYFKDWYGPFAGKMHTVYNNTESAWRYISQWRSWSGISVLSQLLKWDGRKPDEPLSLSEHFHTAAEAIQNGLDGIRKMQDAIDLLCQVRSQPELTSPYDDRLAEDARSLRYGMDSLALITHVLAYFEALRTDNLSQADEEWKHIELLADRLDDHWIPMSFAPKGQAGFVCRDALTRTQLKNVIQKCRQQRCLNHQP